MAENNFELLMQEINERLAGLDGLREQVSEERIAQIVRDQLNLVVEDETFVRKMRFGAGAGERKLVGSKYARWGLTIGDVEFLYDLMTATERSRLSAGPSEELRNTWKALSDAVYLDAEEVRRIDRRAIDELFPRIPVTWFHGGDRALAERGAWELTGAYQAAIRAMDTAESGYGSQLIGAQYVGELWDAARREGRIFPLIDSFEMTDPTAYLPVEVDFPELLFVGESTSASASAYTTVKTGSQRVQVDAKKFVIHQMWSGEMEEDSIVPYIPFIRRQAQLGVNYYTDSLLINGDTTNAATGNINLDDADPADTKHYLAFDGIRHVGLSDNTNNQDDVAAALVYDDLIKARGRMIDSTNKVDWGHPNDPMDLIYAADPDTADRIALLDEVITVDKMGERATVLTGQQARIGLHPLISTMAVSKTEADGKVSTTGSNNTKGQVVVFNRRGFKVGWRRRIKLESERVISTDQTRIVYSLRLGFGRFSPTGAASGIEAADVLFDITL